MKNKKQIVVEEYHNDKQLEKGRERMAARGFITINNWKKDANAWRHAAMNSKA
jgi:hypothetical protein